jgi:predicted PurR-regulated permease PerM
LRLQSLVYGAVLTLVTGWVLHIGKSVLLPIVFSVLVVYVIVGTTRLVARIPGLGSRMPTSLQYPLALLVIATALWFTFGLVVANLGKALAAFFGVLVALMNYVPYIGSVLSVVIPGTFGLLQFGPSPDLLLLLVLLLGVQFLLGNIVDPYLMANSLNLSPLAIVASLAGWSALWGAPGAFLAVPLTACIAMVLAEFNGTRPIAILLSKTGHLGNEADPQ